MAESESGQEKTEQPTPKRLNDARERGDSPRSAELATASVFIASILVFMAFGGWMTQQALGWMREQLENAGQARGMGFELVARMGLSAGELFMYMGPLFIVCFMAAFVAPLVMGLNISTEALAPNLERLSPLAGIKRMWGPQGLGEFGKSLLRVLMLGTVGTLYFIAFEGDLLYLAQLPLATAAPVGFSLILGLLVVMGVGLLLLAALDVPFQLWSWKRRQKMTLQEVLEESKETDGRPEVKQNIRRLQHEMANRRMMDAVPTADVIVVNPTHYAVALKYDTAKARAPIVVAKGADEVALHIRKIADAHKVPIVSAPPLARVLYAQSQIGREIPVKLYQAVAQVLSYVYQLRVWNPRRGPHPNLPGFDDLERPDSTP